MKIIDITEFNIEINKSRVMNILGCFENSSSYNIVSDYFDALAGEVLSVIEPQAIAAFDDDRVYCALTVGGRISDFSKALFDSGEGMRGMLADAMADDYLFEMDNVLSEHIRQECAVENKGVKSRMDAPKDFPLSEQEVIIQKTGSRIGLTDAFMLSPVKSFAYILTLTDDAEVFNAQHDCSKCSNYKCPRRGAVKGRMNVLSGYSYTPSLPSGQSAVCIDIGTTTVVFELVTEEGVLNTYKTVNPQRRFGIDVLSRIEAANRGRGGELASMIQYTLLSGYNEVTRGLGDADRIVIAANTAMVHLMMNYSCASLGVKPFTSAHLEPLTLSFDKIAEGAPAVDTFVMGGISAFVGGDIVSGLYMCDFDLSEKINVFIDLGTNGEMAVGNRERILVASASAGPAFEGGRISCGTGSVDGAVCSVDLEKGKLRTIGGKRPPSGLCGTGIIELCSELLEHGIMDRSGLLCDDCFTDGFKVAEDVVFTQSDIRQVQMAKSAVRAGLETLMHEYGVNASDIDTVYIAGGFGYGLSVKKACSIGILPPEFKTKAKAVGNSSLGGGVKLCSESEGRERLNNIQRISKEISLAENKEFGKMYIDFMNFK